jgi:EpsI family protein
MATASVKVAVFGTLVVALILVGPVSRSLPARTEGVLSVPDVPPDCVRSTTDGGWRPHFEGANDIRAMSVECGDVLVGMHAAMWTEQSPGREAVSDANHLLPATWRFDVRSRSRTTPLGHPVTEHTVNLGAETWVIWAWYMIGDDPATDDLRAKTVEAINAVGFRRAAAARFAIGARAPSAETARRVLEAHAQVIRPALLVEARQG